MKSIAFLLIAIIHLISCTINIEEYKCPETTTNLKIGDKKKLCIHFVEEKQRVAFEIEVDKYSVISIGEGFKKAINSNGDTTVFAQIGELQVPYPVCFFKKENNETFPLFNLVIKVNEGKIYDIVWDNGCFACENSDNCVEFTTEHILNNTATSTFSNCKEDSDIFQKCQNSISEDEGNSSCDPKFYVTWFGTDKDKRQLKSSNLAMSKFKRYSVGSLYKSAKNILDKVKDKIISKM